MRHKFDLAYWLAVEKDLSIDTVANPGGFQGRHSRIPDFLKEIFLRVFLNGTLAQNTYVCLSLVCLAMLPSTKMKLAMGFVHTLINVEILVLLCALRSSEFCVIL